MTEIWRAISVKVDIAPTENGPEFDMWCAKYGFNPLNSPRRAWCSQYGSYFRDALGVAITGSGETFLIYEDDIEARLTFPGNPDEMEGIIENTIR